MHLIDFKGVALTSTPLHVTAVRPLQTTILDTKGIEKKTPLCKEKEWLHLPISVKIIFDIFIKVEFE